MVPSPTWWPERHHSPARTETIRPTAQPAPPASGAGSLSQPDPKDKDANEYKRSRVTQTRLLYHTILSVLLFFLLKSEVVTGIVAFLTLELGVAVSDGSLFFFSCSGIFVDFLLSQNVSGSIRSKPFSVASLPGGNFISLIPPLRYRFYRDAHRTRNVPHCTARRFR